MQIGTILKDTDGLYHKDIGFPENWVTMLPRNFSPATMTLSYGSHARAEALSDKYGSIQLPQRLSKAVPFEIEVQNGTVVKIGVRMPHDELNDIIVIFQPKDGFVRTVWLNRKTDSHKTLDAGKYRKP